MVARERLTKTPKFGIKNALFGYFWARISKNYCHIWNQLPRICLIAKFLRKAKMPKCGIKNALFGYFWPKISYLGILGRNFEKTIVIFEISTLKFVYLENFTKKQNCLNLGQKMPDLGILGARVWKQYCHIWNQHPGICLIAKFLENTEMRKFGTRNALFGYFFG